MILRVSESTSPPGRMVRRSGSGSGAVAICNEFAATIEGARPSTSPSE
jgi:hypothetical protein